MKKLGSGINILIIEEVDVNYSISKEKSGRGKYKELIITNY